MACIRERARTGKNKSKRPWLSVHWRDDEGRKRSKSLRTTDMRVAQAERARIEEEVEGRAAAPAATPPDEAFAQFLDYLSKREGLRARTVEGHRERLGPLFQAFRPLPMARWSRSMLQTYTDGHPDWSRRTIQLVVISARKFARWCEEDGNVACPDFVGRSRGLIPKEQQHTDYMVFTLREIALLMEEVRGTPHGNEWIDLAVHLAFWAALPLGDIRTLEWKHIDLESGTLKKRRQKTGELIVVPISKPLRECMERHLATDGLVLPRFPASYAASRAGLARRVAGLGLTKRPKGQGGWHLLRHSAASALDCACARESSIRLILGHKARSMTGHYIHARLEQAREDMALLEAKYTAARREILQPRLEQREAKRAVG